MTVLVLHLVEVVSGLEVGLEQIFKVLGRDPNTFVSNLDADRDKAACSGCD